MVYTPGPRGPVPCSWARSPCWASDRLRRRSSAHSAGPATVAGRPRPCRETPRTPQSATASSPTATGSSTAGTGSPSVPRATPESTGRRFGRHHPGRGEEPLPHPSELRASVGRDDRAPARRLPGGAHQAGPPDPAPGYPERGLRERLGAARPGPEAGPGTPVTTVTLRPGRGRLGRADLLQPGGPAGPGRSHAGRAAGHPAGRAGREGGLVGRAGAGRRERLVRPADGAQPRHRTLTRRPLR
ncbi:hypothetical protein LT493_15100 [Streptomyces tricolor]|nr:hypothetical protein [Streptomyces tricolor]